MMQFLIIFLVVATKQNSFDRLVSEMLPFNSTCVSGHSVMRRKEDTNSGPFDTTVFL